MEKNQQKRTIIFFKIIYIQNRYYYYSFLQRNFTINYSVENIQI